MDTIPGKQLHQRAATVAALKAVLSEREVGFCDADSTLYIKIGSDLVEAVPYLQAIATAKQEILEEIGKPLKWIDDATVAYLNGTITGLDSGWTYTLTDSGTLTAGNVHVEPGDEVAWSAASSKWIKIGGDAGKVTIYDVTLSGTTWTYPDASKIDYDLGQGKYCVLKFSDGTSTSFYFLMSGPASTSATSKSIQFYNFSTKGALLATYASNTWSWSANSYSPYPVFSGSTPGLVPTATAADAAKALRGDGTWGTVSTVNVSYDSVAEQLWIDFQDHTNEVLIGGRWYKTVAIGNQTWLAENLDYKFSGCDIGPNGAPSTPAAWYFSNDEATYGIDGTYKCGLLYNWYAAKYLEDNKSTLLPAGWRVPVSADFQTLVTTIGGSQEGTKIRSNDIPWATSWQGTNDTGFSALPCGIASRTDGDNAFYGLGQYDRLWTPTDRSGSDRQMMVITDNALSYDSLSHATQGCTIRLVKDNT